MPMPKPTEKEDHNKFVDRCMSDDMMNEEYPEEEQRRAVCETQWTENHEGKKSLFVSPGRALSALSREVWAIEPHYLAEMTVRLRAGAIGPVGVSAGPARQRGAVAVIPIYGVLEHRASLWTMIFGGTSYTAIQAQVRAAVAAPDVGSIVLHIDSPGGSVAGLAETAAEILAARDNKKVIAVADTLCASAAYWLGSQASEIVVTPSAEVGSIGVITAHEDISAMLEGMGVKVTTISAGKFKVEGSPFEPLGDEAKAALQKRVDEYYDMFARAVAKGRNATPEAVRSGFGEGRVVGAKEAVKLGMADRMATMGQVFAKLGLAAEAPARAEGEAAPLAAGASDTDLRARRLRLLLRS